MLVLVGCGPDYDPDLDRPNVNKDLAIYVNRFVQVGESLGRPVSLGRVQVEFVASMERSIIGKCYYGYMTPRVEINRSYWDSPTVSNSDRESLVFHELGHCLLGRGHDDANVPGYNWLDASIMNTYHLPRAYYENNWQYYMRELFGLPFYFSLSATSQFPAEYYQTPGLVPIAPDSDRVFCKVGAECSMASNEKPTETESGTVKVYTTEKDDLDDGFHCGEESHQHE
jgi:hypothetical protein